METIADNLHHFQKQFTVTSSALIEPETPLPATITPAVEEEIPKAPESKPPKAKDAKVKKLTARSKRTIFNMTRRMRDKGDGWEKIARAVAAKGYPTLSGNGRWRGASIKSLYEKMGDLDTFQMI